MSNVERWDRQWTYDAWRAIVCAKGREADEGQLTETFAARIDPHYAVELFSANKLFRYPKTKRRRTAIDEDEVQRRLALAIWRECSVLLARYLTPEARAIVIATQERVQGTAGIIGERA